MVGIKTVVSTNFLIALAHTVTMYYRTNDAVTLKVSGVSRVKCDVRKDFNLFKWTERQKCHSTCLFEVI